MDRSNPHAFGRPFLALGILVMVAVLGSARGARADDEVTVNQFGCALSTVASVFPAKNLAWRAVVKAGDWAYCPGFLDAIGPSPPFDTWGAGCFPQLGSYSTCPWAQHDPNVQEWISSGRALNGLSLSGSFADSTSEDRLTCIFIVATSGMLSPAAAQNQGGCTSGHLATMTAPAPPPPAPDPPPPVPDAPAVPSTFVGDGYICQPGGTQGYVYPGTLHDIPEDTEGRVWPWPPNRDFVGFTHAGGSYAVLRAHVCSTREFVGPDHSGDGFVCAQEGTLGLIWGGLKYFPAGFGASITPWSADPDGYVTLWDQGAPFLVPRGDVCPPGASCGLGPELALLMPLMAGLRRWRRGP